MKSITAAIELAKLVESQVDVRPHEIRSLVEDVNGPCLYYRYFYELAQILKEILGRPPAVLEIGTYRGVSAAAWAWHGCRVVTLDINPDAKRQVENLGIPGITPITVNADDPLAFTALLNLEGPSSFDVLYIDGNHTFNNFWIEYIRYRRLVKNQGLIFADDLALDMATREMQIAWDLVPEPKYLLPQLHHTGFGVIEKLDVLNPMSWEEASRVAAPLMATAERNFKARAR